MHCFPQAASISKSMQPEGESRLLPDVAMNLWQMNATKRSNLGTWNVRSRFTVDPNHVFTKIKRHFKIGVIVVSAVRPGEDAVGSGRPECAVKNRRATGSLGTCL